MDQTNIQLDEWDYDQLFLDILRCPNCRGVLKYETSSAQCMRCGINAPKLFGRFPNFVGLGARLSPTEQIELTNLNEQAVKIHCLDWKNSYNESRINKVIPQLPKGGLILDIGSADGQIASFLRKTHGFRVIAVEKAPKWLEIHGVTGIPFVFSDVNQLPFENETFDAVFMGEILEHLYDPIYAAKEALRVLKPGGLFIATVPNFFFLIKRLMFLKGFFPEDPGSPLTHEHIRIFSRGAIEGLFDKLKLTDRRIEGVWPDGFFTLGILRPMKLLQVLFTAASFWISMFAVTFVFSGKKPRS